jgi:hypothetical protein
MLPYVLIFEFQFIYFRLTLLCDSDVMSPRPLLELGGYVRPSPTHGGLADVICCAANGDGNYNSQEADMAFQNVAVRFKVSSVSNID